VQGSLACQLSALLRAHLFRLEVQLTFLSLSFAAHIIPYLSFAVLMQFVSETLAPSSLFDIFACSLLWQPRESLTCLIFGPHHNPDSLSLSLFLIRRPPLDWQLADSESTLSPPPSPVRGSCLFTRIDHPTAPWRSAGYCRSFESRTSTPVISRSKPLSKPNTPWQAI
jgi:hypothetical protein